jgi:hypothetical protein
MPKYRVIADVVTTAYVGDIDVKHPKEAWAEAANFCKQFRDKHTKIRHCDEDRLYFEDLSSIEPIKEGDGEYVPAKWEGGA